jgi:hypothetical protein
MKSEVEEEGRSLMMRKILMKPKKEEIKPFHRNNLFRTPSNTRDMVCKVIIDNGRTDNLVSTEMVGNIKLEMNSHPNLYKVLWFHKGHQVMVSQQCKV